MIRFRNYPKHRWPPLVVAVVALAAHGALAADPAVVPATLHPTAGVPTTLELNLPVAAGRERTGWDTANVAQFFVRSAGVQKSFLPLNVAPDAKQATYSVEKPGPALLCLGVGPPETRGHSDSWQRVTHCVKIVLQVRPKDADQAPAPTSNAGLIAKTGQKIEILPLVDPTRVRKGDDLPLRVYYEGGKVEGGRVTATVAPPAGEDDTKVEVSAARPTDAEGTTWLPITQAGTWVVRFVHEVKGDSNPEAAPQRYVAELVFDVAEGVER